MNLIILNIHIVVTTLYLLNYLIKSGLFLLGNRDTFRIYRKRTMWVEMVFPLVKVGGFGNVGTWFHIKLTLVLLSIPIGIIGMKKEKKPLVILSILILVYVYLIAWTKNPMIF